MDSGDPHPSCQVHTILVLVSDHFRANRMVAFFSNLIKIGVLGALLDLLGENLRVTVSILILVVTGAIIQHAFGLTDGMGIDGIRNGTIITGHAGFAIEAVSLSEFSFFWLPAVMTI